MNVRAPTLRRHASGQYIAKWGGRTHYFGHDKKAARAAFLDPSGGHAGALIHWQRWSEARTRVSNTRRLSVAELAARFMAELAAEQRFDTEVYYRTSLRRFINVFGPMPADSIDAVAFGTFRASLVREQLAPKTISHELKAAKRLWTWASDPAIGLAPALNLASIKPPRIPRSRPEDLTIAQIRAGLVKASAFAPWLEAYLALNYLAALRPSEVVRLAYGQGTLRDISAEHGHAAVDRGVVELDDHKMVRSSGHARVVFLSPAALVWYRSLVRMPVERARARRRPGDTLNVRYLQGRYGRACARAGLAGWPHRMRDSAATHLLALGAARGDTDLILGHAPTGELGRYGRSSERALWDQACRLALR